MATYQDDFLFSDSLSAPPMSPLVADPQAGIGLQPPAPVEDRFVPRDPMGAPNPQAPLSDRQEFLNSRSFIGRMALPFNEMAAARRGDKSEFEKFASEKRRARGELNAEDIKLFADVTNKTFEEADKLEGPQRKSYVALRAKILNSMLPGSGELLTSLNEDPEYGKLVMKNAEKSPTLKAALEMGGLKKARELMRSVEGAKLIRGEIEGAEFPEIRTKLQTLGMAAKELMTPDRYKQMQADGFISPVEAAEINEMAKAHPKYKAAALTPEQLNLASRNEDATYGMAGYATSKTAQEGLKKAGDAPKTRTVQRGDQEVTEEFVGGKWKVVGSGPKFKTGDPAAVARSTELKLADDYSRDSKGFKDVKTQFSSTADYVAKAKFTSAGDRSLLFAYAKMNDPGDKVAVRDIQDIEKLGNVPQRFIQAIKNVATGKMLPDDVRSDMYAEIKRKFGELNKAQRDVEKDYTERAGRYKLDARNVVRKQSVDDDKPKVGETVQRGGKSWRVVGFDKDGEPLVEPVE